ncbi:protein glp-1-like [Mytilus trossulus]|uniref:protein glp-1-like n=1 Tax=Mytilus trossulus TaxID=6551 RepID=UPI00300508EE
MMKVLYFCVWISGLIGQGHAYCKFTPHASKTCLEFWTFTDMTYGCLNVKDNMKFSGQNKIVDGEHFISVNTTDMNTGNIITVWVRKADGHCTMNCCDRKTNQRRFLLVIHPDLNKECEYICHGHSTSCALVGFTVFCDCKEGYSGHHCDKEDPCHNVACQNGGQCSSGLCSCMNGFTGHHCEIKDPCHDVMCQNGGLCLSGLCGCVNGFIGRRCEMMMPATTVKSIQTTQTTGQKTISPVQNIQSTLPPNQQTIPSLKQCADEQFINCQDPDICQSPFSGRCPLSCGICGMCSSGYFR